MIKTVLKISGMACGMCESHINDAIRRNFKIKKVKSSFLRGETEIISEEALDGDMLKKIIDETGYSLISVDSEPFFKKRLFGKK